MTAGLPGWAARVLLALAVVAWAVPAQARPHVLVVLADHLTLADVTRPDLPGLTRLRQEGQIGLMSPGQPQGADPVATVYATLGAGDSIAVGNVSQGRMGQILKSAGVRTALIGEADGDDTGPYRPALQLLPAPDEYRACLGQDGTIADPLAPGGRRIDPGRLWARTQSALARCDLVIVQDGDFARAERENRRGDLLPRAYAAHRRQALYALDNFLACFLRAAPPRCLLLLIVPTPPFTGRGGWDQLTLCLRLDPPSAARPRHHATLESDTTQTPDLIAARDIAPTILAALGIPRPIQMTGSPAVPAGAHGSSVTLPLLRHLARMTMLNQEIQNPLFWGIGLIAPALIFGGLALYLSGNMTRWGGARRASLYSLRLLAAWSLALLLAPVFHPATLTVYSVEIAALIGALALLPSPTVIFSLTAVILVLDGLTGTRLIVQSALSEYALSGIRFYGIGNEYMGVLIGGALLAVLLPGRLFHVADRHLTIFWFALVTFTLSFPAFGAKAGGAVTATATFALAWLRLRGIPLRLKHVLFSVAAGFTLVFVWAAFGHLFAVRRTHLETGVDALAQGRFGYIVGVALRKIGLAARVTLHPGALLGIAALALLGTAGRALLRRQVNEYFVRRPRFAAIWQAGLWGALIALLVNDSGVVAAILLLHCLILTLLHGLYMEIPCVSSRLTSAMSESASPSPTN